MNAHRALGLTVLLAALATGQDNPVTNGSFERITGGVADDWSHVGTTVGYSDFGRTGAHAFRMWREPGQTGEVGLNRAWRLNSGERGAMLEQRRGALEFWYRIERLDDDVTPQVMAIAMNSAPIEGTGEARRTCELPRSHAGDGQWHRAVVAYDFEHNPQVRWVHVSARLVGSGAGEVLLDDVRWLPEAGPILQVRRLWLEPDPADWYGAATLIATLTNVGDQPVGPVDLELRLPDGWRAEPLPGAVAGLPPDTYRNVSWRVIGRRTGAHRVSVTARAGESESEASLEVKLDLKLRAVLCEPRRPQVGETASFEVILDNRGAGEPDLRIVTSSLGLTPTEGTATVVTGPADPPERIIARCERRVVTGEAHRLLVRVLEAGREVASETVEVAVAGEPGPTQQLGGAVEVSPQGAVGRVVVGGIVLAELPHLGKVVYRSNGEVREVVPAIVEVRDGTAVGTAKDADGGTWTFTFAAAAADGVPATALEATVRCDVAREVLAFYGPELYVPGRRGEALFAGLEWLAPGELSSNDLDIAENHPQRVRLTTHPNNVTIPLMAAATDRGVVGLLWDAHQRWDGRRDRPQPIFASPDWFGHVADSRLGLMVPSVADGLPENTLLAEQPVFLGAGSRLTLAGHVFHEAGGKDVLDAQDAWFALYRPEPVLDYPRGSLEAELTLSARAYLESLWDEEEQAWWPFHGGPGIWRKLHRSPQYCYDLLQIAALAPELPLAKAAKERAESVLQATGDVPAGYDMGYYAGDPAAGIRDSLMGVSGALLSREPDGGWSYRPPLPNDGVFKGMNYYELGRPGAKANGLFALRVREMLRNARLVGDLATYRDLAPSLECLASFTIPRAAQVWEVPVHTPDILAAADACEAFIEAYRLSGDERWLTQAKRQARTGLPFVYVWNDAGKPWMRYGSIPVFGATWFQGSWFGRLVQWNGLRYAGALIQLQPLDPETRWGGLSWADLARGLMISCMYQQREDEGYAGLWPDALGCVDEVRANWEFAPRQILDLLFQSLGRVELPQTVALTQDGTHPVGPRGDMPRLQVSALAAIESGRWTADGTVRLSFVQPKAPAAVRATIANLARPNEVLIAGRPAPEIVTLRGRGEPAWRYDAECCLLSLILPATERCEVELRGVSHQAAEWRPGLVDRIAFEFDEGTEGWRASHDLEPLRAADGLLLTRSTGNDPYLVRSACAIAPDTVKAIRIRYRASAGRGGQLFWTTAELPNFDEAKSLRFEFQAGDDFTEVVVPVGEHALWRGQTITALRIDPLFNPGEVAIDYVRGE